MVKLAAFIVLLLVMTAHAQPGEILVPDLTGMRPPEAAALLSRSGLTFGQERIIALDTASDDPENTVARQSPEAGALVPPGTVIDIDVLRRINARLLYDDNDLTLVNLAAGTLDLRDITFAATEGSSSAAFPASRWAETLPQGQCAQLWSVARTTSKPIEGCGLIVWRTDSNRDVHFWTTSAGASQFAVLQDSVTRATCSAAGPGTQDAPLQCDIVLDRFLTEENVAYIYMAYTPDAFVVRNQSDDRWMLLDAAVIEGRGPLLAAAPASPSRIAPGQCLLLSADAAAQPPAACDVAAQNTVASSQDFWNSAFRVVGSDGVPRACEPAADGILSICILPR